MGNIAYDGSYVTTIASCAAALVCVNNVCIEIFDFVMHTFVLFL